MLVYVSVGGKICNIRWRFSQPVFFPRLLETTTLGVFLGC